MTDYSRAECARPHVDPEIFFTVTVDDLPDSTKAERKTINQTRGRQAKAVCSYCPLRDACLDEHLTEPAGIWGGLSVGERQSLAEERGVTWDDEVYVDETAIERTLAGSVVFLDRDTRLELIRRLIAQGVTHAEITRIARASSQTIRVARAS